MKREARGTVTRGGSCGGVWCELQDSFVACRIGASRQSSAHRRPERAAAGRHERGGGLFRSSEGSYLSAPPLHGSSSLQKSSSKARPAPAPPTDTLAAPAALMPPALLWLVFTLTSAALLEGKEGSWEGRWEGRQRQRGWGVLAALSHACDAAPSIPTQLKAHLEAIPSSQANGLGGTPNAGGWPSTRSRESPTNSRYC